VLIDGEQLCNVMIDFGIGVSTLATYEVKRIDNDYFSEERVLSASVQSLKTGRLCRKTWRG
jgi:hypothetical protein